MGARSSKLNASACSEKRRRGTTRTPPPRSAPLVEAHTAATAPPLTASATGRVASYGVQSGRNAGMPSAADDAVRALLNGVEGVDHNGPSDENGNTPLFLASKNGHAETVYALLDAGADANAINENGITALLIASANGHLEVVRALLASKADVGLCAPNGGSPLHRACSTGHSEVVRILLDHGANVNAGTHDDSSPLHDAVEEEHADIVQLLLRRGASVDRQTAHGYAALYFASANKSVTIARLLVEQGADMNLTNANAEGWTALQVAAWEGSTEIVRLLLDRDVKVNAVNGDGETALTCAVKEGHTDIVIALTDHFSTVNYVNSRDGCTPLICAAQLGHLEVLKALLNRGALVDAANSKGQTALYVAAQHRSLEITRWLLEYGATADLRSGDGDSPLHVASAYGNNSVGALLLDRNASINGVNLAGETALVAASRYGHTSVIQLLLDRKADMEIRNAHGRTALNIASSYGHLEIVRLLLDRAAITHEQITSRGTSLVVASMNGHIDVVKELLDRSVHADFADEDGDTPLGMAAFNGNTDVATVLLDRAADANLANMHGATPLYGASMSDRVDVAQLLLDRHAFVDAADANADTPLHVAAMNGHRSMLLLLLRRNASVDLQNVDGATALHLACRSQNPGVVATLIDHRADAQMVDVNGDSPLICTSREGDVRTVMLLLSSGALLEAKNACLETPLLAAAKSGYFSVVRVFLNAGARLDVRASSGETPLTYAAHWGQQDFVSSLVEGEYVSFTKGSKTVAPLLIWTLEMASRSAPEMHEFQDMWRRIIARLDSLCSNFEQEEAVSQSVTRQFVMILMRLIKLKTTCENTNVITRFVASRKIVSSFQDFHTEIDFLQQRVARSQYDATQCEWRQALAKDQSKLIEIFERGTSNTADLALTLKGEVDRIEALSLLQYETTEHGVKYSDGQFSLLASSLVTVIQLCAQTHGDRFAPKWFLPPHEVEALGVTLGDRMYRAKWQHADVIVSNFDMPREMFVGDCGKWFQLSHPNVVKLFGASHFRQPLRAVFENASSTSLFDYLASHASHGTIWQKLYEVALGVNYLHQRGIILGKIQCADIWIGTDRLAKVAAFGKYFGAAAQSVDDSKTLPWKSHQVLTGHKPTIESDVYSFGMCIIEALGGRAPWLDKEDYVVCHNVKFGDLPRRPESMNDNQWRLVREMCALLPSKRTPLVAVVEHLKRFAIEELRGSTDPEIRSHQALASVDLHDFIVPELSSTIETFLKRLLIKSSSIIESKNFALHVHARLTNVYAHLQKARKLPRDVEVTKFCEVLISFDSFLRIAVSATSVAQRAKSRKVSLKSNILHRGVDGILNLLNIATVDPVHMWKQDLDASQPSGFSDSTGKKSEFLDEAESSTQSGGGSGSGVVKFLRFEASNTNRKFDAIDTTLVSNDDTEGPTAPWFIPIFELKYTQDDYIGMGAFGAVYRGAWLGTPVVVKFMGYEADSDPDAEEMFLHELRVWYPLTHPHVIKLYGACHAGKRFFVCEYAANGTLRDFLQDDDFLSKTWKKLYDVALGLQYLHEQNIVHNDMKCDNFLVGGDGKAKITDFGLSCIANSAEVKIDPKQQGAQQWKAPEYLRGERSTFASDVYSFGMCILEAVTGKTPWGSVADVFVRAKVRKGFLPPRPTVLNDDQWNLIEMMCASEPSHRLKISSVVEMLHEFSKRASATKSAELKASP